MRTKPAAAGRVRLAFGALAAHGPARGRRVHSAPPYAARRVPSGAPRLTLPAALALLLTLAPLGSGASEDEPAVATAGSAGVVAFVGARLLPIEAAPIEDGVLVVADGRIALLGARGTVAIPADAEVRDVAGLVLMPGLVCTHSHIGQVSGGDDSAPVQPEVRALDAIDVLHPSLARARAGGITTVNVMPGSGHVLSGQTVYLKLRRGSTIEALAIRLRSETDGEAGDAALGPIAGGLKMANGTNPQRAAPFPGTRARTAALARQTFVRAVEYRAALERAAADPDSEPPARDLGLEPLVEVLAGRRIVHHHTHRADDILTAVRIAEEFGFRIVLHHVSEGWKIADELGRRGVPCSLTLVDSPGGKLEAQGAGFETAAALVAAGVPTAFHTDDWITDSRLFLRSPALAVRAGLGRDAALAAVTIEAARMLDLESRIGSLAVGKDADLVLLDGDPLSVYTTVLETWVEGRRVFDRGDADDRLMAVGGWGAGDPHALHLCDGPHALEGSR